MPSAAVFDKKQSVEEKRDWKNDGFLRVPSYRSHAMQTSELWLKGKVVDDAIGDVTLWRVRDALYDLTEFAATHPGGKDWIIATRGTDITDSYETSHLNIAKADKFLKAYHVRDVSDPHNSPFTFKPDGFYCTLRKRVFEYLRDNEVEDHVATKSGGGSISGHTKTMMRLVDTLFVLFVLSFLCAAYFQSTSTAVFAGCMLGLIGNSTHNFWHQPNNWRMYLFDLTCLSSFEWRISHGISHHLYANTLNDLEVRGLEPFVNFLPPLTKEIPLVLRWLSPVITTLVECIALPVEITKRHVNYVTGETKFRPENLLFYVELVVFLVVNHHSVAVEDGTVWHNSVSGGLWLFLVMHMSSSFLFAFLGLTAAHHHPLCWHTGDDALYHDSNKEGCFRDWGAFQIDAIKGRTNVDRGRNMFFIAVWFGEHTLHHLFPTVDHGKLHLLYDIYDETCAEFNIYAPELDSMAMATGKYREMHRVTPLSGVERMSEYQTLAGKLGSVSDAWKKKKNN